MYSLEGKRLESIEDLTTFCLLEGYRMNDISSLENKTLKHNDSTSQLSVRSMTMVKKEIGADLKSEVKKTSFVISPEVLLPGVIENKNKNLTAIRSSLQEISD